MPRTGHSRSTNRGHPRRPWCPASRRDRLPPVVASAMDQTRASSARNPSIASPSPVSSTAPSTADARHGPHAPTAPSPCASGWLTSSPDRSWARYVGRCCAGAAHEIGRPADTGQHEQAVRTRRVRSLDVGVQPVPDHQGSPRAGSADGLVVQRQCRLARVDGVGAGCGLGPPRRASHCRAAAHGPTGESSPCWSPPSTRPPGRRASPRPGPRSRRSPRTPARRRPGARWRPPRACNPARSTSARSPSPPTTRTRAAAPTRSRTHLTAACADVTTSAAVAGTPSPVSWAATVSGVRLELFVTKARRIPSALAAPSASAAPRIGCAPR